jgi:hypothetical protein
MQLQFRDHSNLAGLHAPYSPSQSSWLRYDDEKAIRVHNTKRAADRGTKLHEWAKMTIDLGIKQPRSKQTLYSYVNDAIGFRMNTEVILFYSPRFFGTADAISFRNNMLRIHDLKTGEIPASMEQLEIYAALFCLEYGINPNTIKMELRIYQNDEIVYHEPTADDIIPIMELIKQRDSLYAQIDEEVRL